MPDTPINTATLYRETLEETRLTKPMCVRIRKTALNTAHQIKNNALREGKVCTERDVEQFELMISQIPLMGGTYGEAMAKIRSTTKKFLKELPPIKFESMTTSIPMQGDKPLVVHPPRTKERIDFKKHGVFYRTETGNICQLQKLGTERWGFVCLTCPVHSPHAVTETASASVALAEHLGFELHTADLSDHRKLLDKQFPED